MSEAHLYKIKKALENNRWIFREELPGNDYDISAYWRLSKPNGTPEIHLAFEGLDDMSTLPIEKSFGCHLLENKEISMYFGKVGKSFPEELAKFIKMLSSDQEGCFSVSSIIL